VVGSRAASFVQLGLAFRPAASHLPLCRVAIAFQGRSRVFQSVWSRTRAAHDERVEMGLAGGASAAEIVPKVRRKSSRK